MVCLAFAARPAPTRAELPERLGRQFTYVLAMSPTGTGEAKLYFAARDKANGYALHVTKGKLALVKLAAGKAHTLAPPRPWPWPKQCKIVVQRRLGRIAVAVDGLVAVVAEDNTYGGPNAAAVVKGEGVAASLKSVQPIGKIVFDDDFMTASATGVWQPIRGHWEICAIRVHSRSANPFALFARFKSTAAFRDLYEGRTRRFAGLGVRVRYLPIGLRVEEVYPATPAARADIRLGDLIHTIDARPVASLSRREVIALLCGTVAPDSAARDSGENGDTRPPSVPTQPRAAVLQDRGTCKIGLSCGRNGQWIDRTVEVRPEPIDLDRIDEDVVLPPAKLESEAIAVCGQPFWSDYVFEVSAKSSGRGAMGTVFGWKDRQNHWRIEWTGTEPAAPAPSNAVRLVHVLNGQHRVVAEKRAGFANETYYRLRTTTRHKRIRFDIDGCNVIDYALPDQQAILWGKAGVYARDSNGVYFDDVRARCVEEAGPAPLPRPPTVVFESDAMMRKWAGNPAWEWVACAGGQFWHKFPFLGDVRVELPSLPAKPVQVVLAGDERRAQAGYALACDTAAGTLALSRSGKTVASAKLPPGKGRLVLERKGSTVSARVGDKTPLTFTDPAPLTGSQVGVLGLPGHPAQNVRVSSASVFDDFFREAPVYWDVLSGVWGTMNRWVCEPSWSWFGGRHRAMAAIRHKGVFAGDIAVDVFCGPMMVAYWHGLHERPGDMCVTMCSQSGRLFDGYTLVFGADENRCTRLYRNGQVVAETKDRHFLFPTGYSSDEFDMHRDWFHLSLRKRGPKVQARVYEELALEFEDPEPLERGRVLIWTCHNGILVTRGRISSTRPEPIQFTPNPLAHFDDAVLSNAVDDEVRTHVKKSGGAYELANTVCGGAFGVSLKPRQVDLCKRPVLSFSLKPVHGAAKVDLYFEHEGVRHRVLLTGPSNAPGCITLGAFEKLSAEDRSGWRHMAFGLLEHVRARYPGRKRYLIERPRLANYSNDEYLLAGLSGNSQGTSYALREVVWQPASKPAPIRVRGVELPFEDKGNQSRVTFRLDRPWATFNPAGLEARVTVAGKPDQRYAVAHAATRHDPSLHEVVLDLEAAGVSFAAGQQVTFSLARSGRPPDHEAKWTYDPAKDQVPPSVRVFGPKRKRGKVADFETGLDGCFPVGMINFMAHADAGGRLSRDASTRSEGRFSLRVENKKIGVDFGVGCLPEGFSIGRFPLLSFDYAIPPSTSGIWLTVPIERLGEAIAFATSDGKWHGCEVNLFRLLKDKYPLASDLRAECIWIGNSPWRGGGGSLEGAGFNVDNIRLSPVLGPKDLDFLWQAWDIGGIAKQRSGLTNRADIGTNAALRDGQAFFCAAATDAAGNTSLLTRYPFEYDHTPPEILKVNQNGPDAKGRLLQVFEINGVDPKSIALKIGSNTYRVDGRSLWFNQVSGWLHMNPNGPLKRPVDVTLSSMSDFAGNAIAKPVTLRLVKAQPKPPAKVTAPPKPAPKPKPAAKPPKPKAEAKPPAKVTAPPKPASTPQPAAKPPAKVTAPPKPAPKPKPVPKPSKPVQPKAQAPAKPTPTPKAPPKPQPAPK